MIRVLLAAVVLLGSTPAQAFAAGPLAPLLGAKSPTDRYFVVLNDGITTTSAAVAAKARGATVHHEYTAALKGFSATLPADALDAVRRDGSVAYVEPVGEIHQFGTQNNPPSWGIDRIDQTGAVINHVYQYHATGYGVRVYVVDSGVRRTHSEFQGRVNGGWDFVDNDADPSDCSGHGTHVAGTIAGVSVGVAKQASVIPVRVFDCAGNGNNDRLVAALDWVVRNHPGGPAVVNYSGGSPTSTVVDDAVRALVNTYRISVVAAAGNDNANACGVSPARVSQAITVGAAAYQDVRWGSSNWGTCLDLFAPGHDITSARWDSDSALVGAHGTSMAAPHVAGVAAMYLQANPTASPTQVRDAIVNAALSGVVQNAGTGSPNRLLFRIPNAAGVAPISSLNSMFNNYGNNAGCADWSGADATNSIQLPSGKRAWFFADTYLNSPAERPGGFYRSNLRNSIVIQNGTSLRTVTGGNTCRERDTSIPFWDRYAKTPFAEPGGYGWYWPGDAMIVGGNVVKFFYRNEPQPPFWTDTHSAVAQIPISALENNSVIDITPTLLPPRYTYGSHPINWGLALMQVGNLVYIYGAGIVDAQNNRKLYLAVAAPADLTNPSRWSYNLGGGLDRWSGLGDQGAAGPVSDALLVENGFSVASINGSYWLVQHEPNLNGGAIVAHPANSPYGFTGRKVRLYTPPEGPRDAAHKRQFYYEARIQPGLGAPGKIVVSYNVNSSDVSIGCHSRVDHDAAIYRPRFLDVPVQLFEAGMATAVLAAEPTGSGIEADFGWYDAWAPAQQNNHGCPPLTQPTTLNATVDPDGTVRLSWTEYGRDMWYWVYWRDATAGGSFQRKELWTTVSAAIDAPVQSAATQGHTFEYYVVPWASAGVGGDSNGDGRADNEAPPSNVVRPVVAVQPPNAVPGVSAVATGGGRIDVGWQHVTFPNNQVFYWIYAWKPSAGQTEAQAVRYGPFPPTANTAVLQFSAGDFVSVRMRAENLGGLGAPSTISSTTVS